MFIRREWKVVRKVVVAALAVIECPRRVNVFSFVCFAAFVLEENFS